MAIVLEANYAKKLGLPGFSSHQYSVSIRTELTDLSQIEHESSRLYSLLQDAVDQSIQQTGYLPEESTPATPNGAVHNGRNGNGIHRANGNILATSQWRCSDKQRGLIEKIVSENNLDKSHVEQIAVDMFGIGVRQLNRLQASGLIDELFERYGGGSRRNGKPRSNVSGHGGHDLAGIAASARGVSKTINGGPVS